MVDGGAVAAGPPVTRWPRVVYVLCDEEPALPCAHDPNGVLTGGCVGPGAAPLGQLPLSAEVLAGVTVSGADRPQQAG
ncbi:hypothetical protein CKO45_19010 [Paracraurococcus ruber]|uniref:Uncharacterized protein n=1 Tax=Paracraurococcus ruber TaxID=77675 RepID=A0ABS1D210_9PROT|nr:hypothetical protein [Paracraurococcus ruber]